MSASGVGALREGERAKLIEGVAIQGFSAGKDQSMVDAKLQVSKCYHINGYANTPVDRSVKVIPNDLTIRMGAATKIQCINDVVDIPKCYFVFGNYSEIREMARGEERIIDYIGILESIEPGRTKRKSKSFTNLRLTDSGNETVLITLWEEIVNNFESFSRITIERSAKPVTIAATALRYNNYTERLDLQSTASTFIYVNPPHPERDELLKRYNPDNVKTKAQLALHVINAERITLSDLSVKTFPLPPEKSYLCEGFISDFVTEDNWFYTGCMKCNATAHKSGDIWFCTDCGDIKEVKYKSRLVVMLSSGWTRIKVTMFDDTIGTMLKKPFHGMVVAEKNRDSRTLPDPILMLRGERKNFVLKAQREFYGNTPRFIVKDVLEFNTADTQQLAIAATAFDSPQPSTPHEQLTSNTFETPELSTPQEQLMHSGNTEGSSAKRKIDFESEVVMSPINDTKHIRYPK